METDDHNMLDAVAEFLGNDPEGDDPLNLDRLSLRELQNLEVFVLSFKGGDAGESLVPEPAVPTERGGAKKLTNGTEF
eukprot:12033750-Karenia_brevis.AAC.1